MFERLINEETNMIKTQIEKNPVKYFLIAEGIKNEEIILFLSKLKTDSQQKISPFQYYDALYIKNEKKVEDYQISNFFNFEFVQPNENYVQDFMVTGKFDSLEVQLIEHQNKGFIDENVLHFLSRSSRFGL